MQKNHYIVVFEMMETPCNFRDAMCLLFNGF